LTEDELLPLVNKADGVIAGLDKFTERVMVGAPRLKVISRYGVGLDNVDLQAAKRLGIAVTTTAEANTQAVADLAMGLLIAVSRSIPQAHQSLREGKWERFIGHAVYQKTLGIIGLGRIGKAVAKRASGFEMNILAYDVMEDKSFAASLGVRFLPLAELLAVADSLPSTANLIPDKGLVGQEN